MGGRMDTRLRGYDIKNTGMTEKKWYEMKDNL